MEVIFWIVMFILISPLIVLGAIDGPDMKKMAEREKLRKKMAELKKINLIDEAPPGCDYFLFLPVEDKDRFTRYSYSEQRTIKETVIQSCNELMTTFRNRRMSPVPLIIKDLNSEEREELREKVISSFYHGAYIAEEEDERYWKEWERENADVIEFMKESEERAEKERNFFYHLL